MSSTPSSTPYLLTPLAYHPATLGVIYHIPIDLVPHPANQDTHPKPPRWPTPPSASSIPFPPSSSIHFRNFSAISHPNRSIQASIHISHRFPIQRCDSHGPFRPPSYSRACSLMTHTFQSFPSHSLRFLDSLWSRDVAEK